MSSDPTEHNRRHAVPGRPTDGAVPGADLGAPAPRPLSRRELRERERRRGAGSGGGAGETSSDATAAVSIPGVWPAGATPGATSAGQPLDEPASAEAEAGGDTAVPAGRVPGRPDRRDLPTVEPASRMAETVTSDTSRYRLVHYLALALVACVLGYLIWSLATDAAEPGASSAGPAVSITSPSALPTATQGEL